MSRPHDPMIDDPSHEHPLHLSICCVGGQGGKAARAGAWYTSTQGSTGTRPSRLSEVSTGDATTWLEFEDRHEERLRARGECVVMVDCAMEPRALQVATKTSAAAAAAEETEQAVSYSFCAPKHAPGSSWRQRVAAVSVADVLVIGVREHELERHPIGYHVKRYMWLVAVYSVPSVVVVIHCDSVMSDADALAPEKAAELELWRQEVERLAPSMGQMKKNLVAVVPVNWTTGWNVESSEYAQQEVPAVDPEEAGPDAVSPKPRMSYVDALYAAAAHCAPKVLKRRKKFVRESFKMTVLRAYSNRGVMLGRVVAGRVAVDNNVRLLPSRVTVRRRVTGLRMGGKPPPGNVAVAGDMVSLALDQFYDRDAHTRCIVSDIHRSLQYHTTSVVMVVNMISYYAETRPLFHCPGGSARLRITPLGILTGRRSDELVQLKPSFRDLRSRHRCKYLAQGFPETVIHMEMLGNSLHTSGMFGRFVIENNKDIIGVGRVLSVGGRLGWVTEIHRALSCMPTVLVELISEYHLATKDLIITEESSIVDIQRNWKERFKAPKKKQEQEEEEGGEAEGSD